MNNWSVWRINEYHRMTKVLFSKATRSILFQQKPVYHQSGLSQLKWISNALNQFLTVGLREKMQQFLIKIKPWVPLISEQLRWVSIYWHNLRELKKDQAKVKSRFHHEQLEFNKWHKESVTLRDTLLKQKQITQIIYSSLNRRNSPFLIQLSIPDYSLHLQTFLNYLRRFPNILSLKEAITAQIFLTLQTESFMQSKISTSITQPNLGSFKMPLQNEVTAHSNK